MKIKFTKTITACSCGRPKLRKSTACSVCYHERRFVQLECPVCEELFWANRYEANEYKYIYCSHKCGSYGSSLARSAGLIGVDVRELTNAVAAGLKWCGHHRQWEHFSDFPKSKSNFWGLSPICRSAHKERAQKRRGPIKKYRRRNCETTLVWKSEYAEQVRKYGQIKASCKRMGMSYSTVWHEKRDDPNFAEAVQKAYDSFYQEKYGSVYVGRKGRGKSFEKNELNVELVEFSKNNWNLLETWFKSGALVHNDKSKLSDKDIQQIVDLARLYFIYSALRRVQNHESLAKYYGRCALFNWKRDRAKQVFEKPSFWKRK